MLPTPETIAADLTKAAVPHLGKLLAQFGREAFDKFIATSTNIFADHLKDTVSRCSTTKNILYKDPIPLLTQYVSNDFIGIKNPVSDTRLLQHAKSTRIACLITGLAGSGKSMFMKWLAIQLSNSILHHQRIPLFIEARALTEELIEESLDTIIFESTSSERSKATLAQFKVGLEHGFFIIILDGLDEINPEYRNKFLARISEFRRKFPACSIICSSRPESQIESLADLQVLRIAEMSLDQIKQVISNAIFDEIKKDGFIAELENGLYETHRSFLCNPLLSIIMMITFDNNANVPRKLSSFYSQVFEALFFRHDSSKGIYTREHFAKLEIDQFEEVFRSFCFETYASGRLRFSQIDLTQLVRASLKRSGLSNVVPDLFIKDAKQSVCLLQDDGIESSFVHRSFQEYFSARYLLYYKGDIFPEVLDRLATRSTTDNVLFMLFQMNSIEVKRLWMLPRLKEFVREIDKVDVHDASSIFEFLSNYFQDFTMDNSSNITSLTYGRGSPAIRIATITSLLAHEAGREDPMMLHGRLFGVEEQSIRSFVSSDKIEESGQRDVISRLFRPDGVPKVYFNRHIEGWIILSNLPDMVGALRSKLKTMMGIIEEQTGATEDFTADLLRIMDR